MLLTEKERRCELDLLTRWTVRDGTRDLTSGRCNLDSVCCDLNPDRCNLAPVVVVRGNPVLNRDDPDKLDGRVDPAVFGLAN